jgi:aminoglycoside phosphotransferase (APT) family kinase protein
MRSTASELRYTPAVADWLHEQLGAAVAGGTALPGATTAEVTAFESTGHSYVLKLFNKAFFVEEESDRANHEATVLDVLGGVDLPTPQLVAFDGDGSQCGFPAVLMTRLPGERDVGAHHAAEMVDIATRLHGITAAVPAALPWEFRRYSEGLELRPPRWSMDVKLWSDAFRVIASDPPADGRGFIHRDYNSTNFLTSGDRVTGLVDWLSGCRGPFGIDAARLRLDLTMAGDLETATATTDAFHRSGHDVIDPYWDLVGAVDLLPFYRGYETVDRWGNPVRRARLEGFVKDALSRLGG